MLTVIDNCQQHFFSRHNIHDFKSKVKKSHSNFKVYRALIMHMKKLNCPLGNLTLVGYATIFKL